MAVSRNNENAALIVVSGRLLAKMKIFFYYFVRLVVCFFLHITEETKSGRAQLSLKIITNKMHYFLLKLLKFKAEMSYEGAPE